MVAPGRGTDSSTRTPMRSFVCRTGSRRTRSSSSWVNWRGTWRCAISHSPAKTRLSRSEESCADLDRVLVEVDQFKIAFVEGGGVYEHFVLVAPGLTGSLSPLFSLLHRIRRVGSLNRPWTYRQLTSSFRTGSDFYTTVSNGKSWQETGAPDLAGKVNYMRPKRTSEPS